MRLSFSQLQNTHHGTSSSPRHLPRHRPLHFEALEERRLLSRGVPWSDSASGKLPEQALRGAASQSAIHRPVQATGGATSTTDNGDHSLFQAFGTSVGLGGELNEQPSGGILLGTLWEDANANGVRDAGESGLAGISVYLDLNRNGLLDPGEPSTLTLADDPATLDVNETGTYQFLDLEPGSHVVAAIVPTGWGQSFPATTYAGSGALEYLGRVVDNQDGVDGLSWSDNVVFSPDGQFVYANSSSDDAIAVFRRNVVHGGLDYAGIVKNGVAGITLLDNARGMALSPNGEWLYTLSGYQTDIVSTFARNVQIGEVTQVGGWDVNFAMGLSGVNDIAVSPDGAHAYVVGAGSNSVGIFRPNTTGMLDPIGHVKETDDGVAGLVGAYGVGISPDGLHVYVASRYSDAVTVFARNASTGTLTWVESITSSPSIQGLDGAWTVAISPDGAHVYVSGNVDHAVAVFARDAGSGQLTHIQSLQNGVDGIDGLQGAAGIAISADGRDLYVAGSADDAVAAFRRDRLTGQLAYLGSIHDGPATDGLDGARDVAVAPDGRHVYVTGQLEHSLVGLSRDVVQGHTVILAGSETFVDIHFGMHDVPPVVESIVQAGVNPTDAASVEFTVTFSESVTGVDAGDFQLATTDITGASIVDVSGSGAIYTVSLATGTGEGTLRLDLVDNDSIVDAALQPLGGGLIGKGDFRGETYQVDKLAPTVVSIARLDAYPTASGTVGFAVTFSEPVTGVGIGDFDLTLTGSVAGAVVELVSGSGASYTVTVSTGLGDGTLGLNVVDDDSIFDVVGKPLGGPGAGNGNFTGPFYTIDKPSLITGVKWHDLNSNGARDEGEPGLTGWTFFWDRNGNGVYDLQSWTLDPDDYAAGTLLNNIHPQVTLTQQGGANYPNTAVYAATSARASTGARVFGNAYSGNTWSAGLRVLRIDFASPVSFVRIDAIATGLRQTGRLEAYNASGTLLRTYSTGFLYEGESETMVVSRLHDDIAYVLATGNDRSTIQLDHLVFDSTGGEIATTTGADGSYQLAGIPDGTQLIGEVPQPGWTQSYPGSSGLHTVVVAGDLITGIDFGNWFQPPRVESIARAGVNAANTAAVAFTITFNKVVTGVDPADFTLTRDGLPVEFSGDETIATSDGRTFLLEHLRDETTAPGVYELRLHAARSGIVDISGSPMVENAAELWTNHLLIVQGTDGDDVIEIAAGPHHLVVVNGLAEPYDAALVTEIEIDGRLGYDRITIRGGEGPDRVMIEANRADVSGPGYTIHAVNVETITVDGGGGTGDEATLLGSTGSNRLYSYADYSRLIDSTRSFSHRVEGFETLTVDVSGGTSNSAYLYDTPDNDELTAEPGLAAFIRSVGTSTETTTTAIGFQQLYAYTTAGDDTAALTASDATQNRFYSYADYALLTEARRSFYFYARGFGSVTATSPGSLPAYAYLYDSPGIDAFSASTTSAAMDREDPWSDTIASGFARIYAYSTRGGADRAVLNGSSAGSNSYRGYPAYSTLYDSTQSFYHYVRGFHSVTAAGSKDDPSSDQAYLYDSSGDDTFDEAFWEEGKYQGGSLTDSGDSYEIWIKYFDLVYARSTDSGTNDTIAVEDQTLLAYRLLRYGTW